MNVVLVLDGNSEISAQELLQLFLIASSSSLTLNVSAPKSLYYTNYYCFIFAYFLIITIRFYCRSFTIEVLFNLHSFLNGLFSCHCSMDSSSLLCSAWMICCFCVIIEREIFSLINSMIFNNQVHC